MDIETGLRVWNKKTICKSELEKLLHTGSEQELYDVVSNAVADGLLSPIKSSGKNGNKIFPLYLKYRVINQLDYSEALEDIALLHPSMTKNGYLKAKPELYEKYKVQLQQVNSYLFGKQSKVSISKKERSFAVFGEEKQLEDSAFCNLLNRIGLDSEMLGYYETPEYCFNDYISQRKKQMTLLILENKDIWFNLRRRMYEDDVHELFGFFIDGVVYGCGNRISKIGALTEYTHFMGAEEVQYLYWGDIDRAGLNIYQSAKKNNPRLNIYLFVPAYAEMIRLSAKRQLPDSADNREQIGDYSEIYSLFPDDEKKKLIEIIGDNKRLPQEIITYEYLLDAMG